MDRVPGRLEDGARLLRRLRPQAERALCVPAALRLLFLVGLLDWRRPWRVASLDLARPARVRRLALVLQPGRDRRLGPAPVPGAPLPPRPGALDRPAGKGGGDPAGLADGLARRRRAVPDRDQGRAQRRRRRDDRRRLRERRRRRPDRPRRTALRQLPRRRLRRATPTGRSTISPTSPSRRSGPGTGPGTTCPPRTSPRSSSTWRRSRCWSCSDSGSAPGPAGRRLAATLAFAWAAYPYTAYALESNSNDTLVAMLLVATLVLLARPAARGALAALAGLTKFAPLVLAPMLATYRPAGPRPHRDLRRRIRRHRVPADAVAGDRPGPRDLLGPDDRLPGRPRLPVQHLGPGPRPRAAADRAAGRASRRSRSPSPSGLDGSRWSRSRRSAPP